MIAVQNICTEISTMLENGTSHTVLNSLKYYILTMMYLVTANELTFFQIRKMFAKQYADMMHADFNVYLRVFYAY